MPLAQSATANNRSTGVMVSPVTRSTSGPDPRFAGTIVERCRQPAPVQAVHVVGLPVLLHVTALGLGQRRQRWRGRQRDVRGVERLQPPSAGPRDLARRAVGPGASSSAVTNSICLPDVRVGCAPTCRPRRARRPSRSTITRLTGCRRVARSAASRGPAAPIRVRRAGSRPTTCCAPGPSLRTSREFACRVELNS